jgi:hypothetical protein
LPVVSLKISLLRIFALKSPNIVYMCYVGN